MLTTKNIAVGLSMVLIIGVLTQQGVYSRLGEKTSQAMSIEPRDYFPEEFEYSHPYAPGTPRIPRVIPPVEEMTKIGTVDVYEDDFLEMGDGLGWQVQILNPSKDARGYLNPLPIYKSSPPSGSTRMDVYKFEDEDGNPWHAARLAKVQAEYSHPKPPGSPQIPRVIPPEEEMTKLGTVKVYEDDFSEMGDGLGWQVQVVDPANYKKYLDPLPIYKSLPPSGTTMMDLYKFRGGDGNMWYTVKVKVSAIETQLAAVPTTP